MPNAFVRKLKGYAALGDEEVRLLTAASEITRKVPAQYDLIREGDRPNSVFIVLEGWACRYKILADGTRQIVAFMMPGDFCDIHIGILEEMDHSVGTITACKVVAVPRETMETLVLATPRLTHAFWRAQLVDQGVMRAWIVSMGRRDAPQRIAHLMLELYVRMRSVGLASNETCHMPLTQMVIADALGLTSVHSNRILRMLRERGIMKLRSATLTILNIVELAEIAGFDDNYLHRRIGNAV